MSKDKTVVRVVKRENPFVQIDKTPINDDRLSWKAKGLLVYLLSKPDDWTIMIEDLIKRAKDGRDSVKAGLRELEEAGYLSRKQLRGENGKFDKMEFVVYELPQTIDINEVPPQTENPSTGTSTANGKSVNGKSVNGKTVNGKPPTTNKDFSNKDFSNTDFDDDREKQTPASNLSIIDQFIPYAIERGLHRDFTLEIAEKLAQVNFEITHWTLGEALNKTLDGIEANTVSHVPNFFITVLSNEIKKKNKG